MSPDLQHQLDWYTRELPLRDAVVVDGGANDGRISAGLWRYRDADGVGPRTLHSVEPLSEHLEALRARVPVGADWHVHSVALDTLDGEVELQVESDPSCGWNSAVIDRRARDEGPTPRRVPARCLRTLAPDATVVKLDVEGHEYGLIHHALTQGGEDPLPRAWAIEFHLRPAHPLERTLTALRERGYALFAAGRRAGDASGAWLSAPIPPTLSWAAVPVAGHHPDGTVFKMLHVIARREG